MVLVYVLIGTNLGKLYNKNSLSRHSSQTGIQRVALLQQLLDVDSKAMTDIRVNLACGSLGPHVEPKWDVF